ncbi:hypothetical protein SJC15_24 [Bacteroides phage SJC15]|nr:hypothetical protein SJC11_24 [Bacteroides phage SJC11]QIG65248.1 hypothetical protein SJC15_24 [Bacteroides phage SJC15]QIG65395.1 hypothetical protein SJC18_24 [Bacteroides phage SJC18]QIG65442.1 hypothetical protein SJC20_24 [Bacteroides phage SJC20]QIG65490.1 hypothetical protein SJC22_24 [Bacteroides phage SJC22]
MKIEISIDRESKVYELKALSLFAESLASGRHIEEVAGAVPPVPAEDAPRSGNFETGRVVNIGKSAAFEPVVTEKAKEAVQEAPEGGPKESPVQEAVQSDEPTVEDVLKMTEEEMKNVPTPVLVEALNSFGIDPATRPGKNTNAKLRGLLVSAIAEADNDPAAEETNNAEEIKPQEDPEVPTVEAQDESTVAEEDPEEVTIDMLRDIARSLIAANKRKVIAEAFEACGCSNFSTLKNKDYTKFYDLCKKG